MDAHQAKSHRMSGPKSAVQFPCFGSEASKGGAIAREKKIGRMMMTGEMVGMSSIRKGKLSIGL